MVRNCTIDDAEYVSEFIHRLNNIIEHSSNFSYKKLDYIKKELRENIVNQCAAVSVKDGRINGVITCFVDEEKSNVDCSIFVDPKEDFSEIAGELLNFEKGIHGQDKAYGFFFSKENDDCRAFLDGIGARREVNEYELIIKKGWFIDLKDDKEVEELSKKDYSQFIKLHDEVFPDVYISGREIIDDIGKERFVFAIIDDGSINAYSVLNYIGTPNMTAEIVGVRREFRGRHYGHAVLSHLIKEAFSKYKAENIFLIVDCDNDRAISMYKDIGFRVNKENCSYKA